MSDEPGYLALLRMVTNDEAMRGRLTTLQEKMDEIAAAQVALDRTAAENQQILASIHQERQEVEKQRDELNAREAKLAADHASLSQVVDSHTAEAERWRLLTADISAKLDQQKTELSEIAASQVRVDQQLTTKAAELREREREISAREMAHQRRHQTLEAALTALKAA